MRELERDRPVPGAEAPSITSLTIVGAGRVGRSLASAAAAAGIDVALAGRGSAALESAGADAALLCVPDDEIGRACARVCEAEPMPRLVGHVSGATPLAALASAAGRDAGVFSLHPLQTFADGASPVDGTPAAVAASDAEALAAATGLAERLGMRPFSIPEDRRAAYHAAAAIASNLLVALEESAARLLSRAGVDDARKVLAPLVLRTAANWSERGAGALTGPIARGDKRTVARHREALADLAPELLPLYDALSERARGLAASPAREEAGG